MIDLLRRDRQNIIKKIKQNIFLPKDTLVNNFTGSDSESLFKKNLKKLPNDWYYRHNKVTYTVNKHHYRCKEFEDIDWAESVVIFGCSYVFGIGIDDEHTISNQLEKIIGRPVINLGAGGSSTIFSLHNSIILRNGYPTPKGIVHLWTDSSRCTFYESDNIKNLGSWNMTKGNLFDSWTADYSNPKTHLVFTAILARQIWDNKTKYYEASFFLETAAYIECDLIKIIDTGRDLMHQGKNTNKNIAELIARKLEL